jgi:hypothetical protein
MKIFTLGNRVIISKLVLFVYLYSAGNGTQASHVLGKHSTRESSSPAAVLKPKLCFSRGPDLESQGKVKISCSNTKTFPLVPTPPALIDAAIA